MNETHDDAITPGSGNVFADLGLADPQGRSLKARLASTIYDEIEIRGWTQTHAATMLGLSQPDISRLTRGILNGFSIERLLSLLATLDYRVSIHLEGENRPSEDIQVAGPS
jgi:predicted XRE-type DNA-binding protein